MNIILYIYNGIKINAVQRIAKKMYVRGIARSTKWNTNAIRRELANKINYAPFTAEEFERRGKVKHLSS